MAVAYRCVDEQQYGRDVLADDCRDCGALDALVQDEDIEEVKKDVEDDRDGIVDQGNPALSDAAQDCRQEVRDEGRRQAQINDEEVACEHVLDLARRVEQSDDGPVPDEACEHEDGARECDDEA